MKTDPSPRPRVVIVTGSRNATDLRPIWRALDALLEEPGHVTIYEGGARGVDVFARWWAERHPGRVRCVTFHADWTRHGKAAGSIRNQLMVDTALQKASVGPLRLCCIAFPGPKSRGTWDMVRRCRLAGIPDVAHRLSKGDVWPHENERELHLRDLFNMDDEGDDPAHYHDG